MCFLELGHTKRRYKKLQQLYVYSIQLKRYGHQSVAALQLEQHSVSNFNAGQNPAQLQNI